MLVLVWRFGFFALLWVVRFASCCSVSLYLSLFLRCTYFWGFLFFILFSFGLHSIRSACLLACLLFVGSLSLSIVQLVRRGVGVQFSAAVLSWLVAGGGGGGGIEEEEEEEEEGLRVTYIYHIINIII
ncbi:hypothetical protein FN846DRAFT_69809 [Sphaerosporella brunnea]|uniref:Uncharacterized protein n=1 Tax=Sphaerosporella brunnea TaxID=1250544 RepID=A0A5J5EU86_9PEZI|nr:hypothetical protein FN846DRAFT_69809 [Sphaerosporella brunnea]